MPEIGDPEHLDALARIAPLTAIRGTIDRGPWAEDLPETAKLTIHGLNIYMIHDRKELMADPEAAGWNVVISGHSHKPSSKETGSLLWLNPGEAGPRLFRLPITLAFLWAEDGRPRAIIHHLAVF